VENLGWEARRAKSLQGEGAEGRMHQRGSKGGCTGIHVSLPAYGSHNTSPAKLAACYLYLLAPYQPRNIIRVALVRPCS
jgi:hypothetical protein